MIHERGDYYEVLRTAAFVTFTGSVLPELPGQLSGYYSGVKNPHKGSRDRLSTALMNYKDSIGFSTWEQTAAAFQTMKLGSEVKVEKCFFSNIPEQ